MKNVALLALLISGLVYADCCSPTRLGKKDRQDLISLVGDPLRKIEQKIDSINQAANQIQNIIIDTIQANSNDAALLECCGKVQDRLGQIELVLRALIYLIQANVQQTDDLILHVAQLENLVYELTLQVTTLNQTMGSVTDVSVGQEIFDSVDDIDNAQLSLISWLKTVYRQQLYDKFIS